MNITSKGKNFILKNAYRLGLLELDRVVRRNKLAILCYHRFASPAWTDGALPETMFEEHLRYLKSHFTIISFKELDSVLQGQVRVENPLILTVDDGYRDFVEVAVPVLKRHGVPATFFVTTRFVDGDIWLWPDIVTFCVLNTTETSVEFPDYGLYLSLRTPVEKLKAHNRLLVVCKRLEISAKVEFLREVGEKLRVRIPDRPPIEFRPVSWDDLKGLDGDLIEIGSHTLTHPILSRVPLTRAKIEIEESKKRIEQALNRKVTTFAYPNGTREDYSPEHQNILKQCGYQVAVTMNFGFNAVESDRFELNRIGAAYDLPRFAKSMSYFEILRQKISNFSFEIRK